MQCKLRRFARLPWAVESGRIPFQMRHIAFLDVAKVSDVGTGIEKMGTDAAKLSGVRTNTAREEKGCIFYCARSSQFLTTNRLRFLFPLLPFS
jgi:hypothetical protein